MPLEKPGTPEELIHFGVRGMKWGVRRAESSGSSGSTQKQGMSTKKKVAIGVGVGVAVSGAVAAGYILRSRGNLSMSSVVKSNKRPLEITGHNFKAFIRSPREQAKWETHMAKTLSEISSKQLRAQKQVYERMDIASRRGVPLNKLIDAAENPSKYKLNFNV